MSTRVIFNNIREEIIKCIDSAEKEILIAVAWFTDETIISHLVKKIKYGITVKIIFYNDRINDKKLFKSLVNNGAKIRCSNNLMHNKFAIIDKYTVINGSYNWTINADKNNHENIQITEGEKHLTDNFIIEFNKLFNKLESSERYFKTEDEIFNEYMNRQKYPYKYPCFIHVEYSFYNHTKRIREYKKAHMIILNKQELNQWYIFKYKREKNGGRDIRKEKEYIFNIYGETEEREGFKYFINNSVSISTNEYLYKINNKGEIISEKIKYHTELGENLFFIIENENNYIYNTQMQKYEIPNYFHPHKAERHSDFLILESSFPNYKAISNLYGRIIIPPFYKEIHITGYKIECIENSIFSIDHSKNGEISKCYDHFRKKEYKIIYKSIHELESNFPHISNEIYLSNEEGKWAEIYIDCEYEIRNCYYNDLKAIKTKFSNRIEKVHNNKQTIYNIKSEIKDIKDKRQEEKRKKRQEKEAAQRKAIELEKQRKKEDIESIFIAILLIIGLMFILFILTL